VARWERLTDFLTSAPDRCSLSMAQLAEIVGELPSSAHHHRAWWSGDRTQVDAWRAAGFELESVSLGHDVTFRRAGAPGVATKPQMDEDRPPAASDIASSPSGQRTPGVILVSCSARKGDRPAPAKDLYTSSLFRKQRAYAEASGAPWFILSAEHGLVAPDEWLAPYDRYLPDTPRSYRSTWGAWVAERLELLTGPLDRRRVEVHASAAYVDAVAPLLQAKGAMVELPLRGLSQGKQLAFYGGVPRNQPAGSEPRERSAASVGEPPAAPDAGPYISALLEQSQAMTPAEFLEQDPRPLRVPGLYSWWVDDAGAADLSRAAGEPVEPGLIYAGLAGATRWPSRKRSTNTLWSRIAGMHLGSRHEFSTFRRSLGALLTALDGTDTVDEDALTAWMHAHLRVITVPHEDADTLGALESEVLTAMNPPLNLQGMPSTPLRRSLTALRSRIRK
jgi:hypothetical protein